MNSLVQHLRGAWPQIELPAVPPEVRRAVGAVRRLAYRHRRPLAVVLSLLLHIAFVLAVLPHSHKGLSTSGSDGAGVGAGTGETYAAVDLYGQLPSPAATTAIKAPDNTVADVLDTPVDPAQPQPTVVQATSADLPQLAQLDAPAPPLPAESTAHPAAAMAGRGEGGTTAGTGDDLWAAIAPCWKRIADSETLPVALEVTFSGDGHLSKPPVIERDAAVAITPRSLKSEARAIDALAQCGAYPMAAGRVGVKVSFPKPD